MFPLYMAVGMSSLWCLEFFIIHLKTNIATLMAQEGVIVQITHCVILKYVKKKLTLQCFSNVIFL